MHETRSWSTNYRGPIAIHAGKQIDYDAFRYKITPLATMEQLEACGINPYNAYKLPRGAVIATAELVNIWRIVYYPGSDVDVTARLHIGVESLSTDKHAPDFGDYFVPTKKEITLGYWEPGNYAWELRNVMILPELVPINGRQGLWNWELGKEENGQ